MAAYLPASLAHALARSNASVLAYVGHSQGTTLAFAALASQHALAAQARALPGSGAQPEPRPCPRWLCTAPAMRVLRQLRACARAGSVSAADSAAAVCRCRWPS